MSWNNSKNKSSKRRVVFPLADGVLSGKNKQPVDVPNICCKQRKKNAPNLEVQRCDDPLAPPRRASYALNWNGEMLGAGVEISGRKTVMFFFFLKNIHPEIDDDLWW